MCYRVSQHSECVTGIVADWLVDWDDIEAMYALIAAMIDDLENEGAESVSLPVVAHPPTIRAFERFGFRRRNGYSIVVIPLARSEPDPAMRDPLQWFVMPGDFDIV
jgi:choline dehydrogenase-like flavoprotein